MNSPHLNDIFNSGKGKAAWDAECARWHSLTKEQQQKEYDEYWARFHKKLDEKNGKHYEEKRRVQEERSLQGAEHSYVYTDTVNTMENSEATIIYIVVMLVGFIFVDRWLIWITATIIWRCFIDRYKIRKWKWDHGGKEEYFKKISDACKGDNKDE